MSVSGYLKSQEGGGSELLVKAKANVLDESVLILRRCRTFADGDARGALQYPKVHIFRIRAFASLGDARKQAAVNTGNRASSSRSGVTTMQIPYPLPVLPVLYCYCELQVARGWDFALAMGSRNMNEWR